MRVTDLMLQNSFLYNLNQIEQPMSVLQKQLATGKALIEPSDNPLGVAQDMAINTALTTANNSLQTIQLGLTWMNSTSSALDNISSTLQSIRGLMLQAQNETYHSTNGLEGLLSNIQQLVSNIYQVIDVKHENAYLFGGYDTADAPSSYLNPSSSTGIPAPASGTIQYQVSPSVRMTVNLTGVQILRTSPSGSTADLATTLNNILDHVQSGLNSLEASGTVGTMTANLQADLGDLDANINSVTQLSASYGAQIQQMNALQSQTEKYITQLNQQKASLENANMAEVITNLTTEQTTYEAALKVGSELLLPSLVKFLP